MKTFMFYFLLFVAFALSGASMYNANPRTAIVRQVNGLCIFLYSSPIDEFEFLGTVKSGMIVASNDMDKMVQTMAKRAKEKYPEADAIIFSNDDIYHCDAIKFK